MVLPEDINLETTYLLITMKDKCIMGEGIFLGESLLPLKNIQQSNRNSNIEIKVCVCPMILYGKDSITFKFAKFRNLALLNFPFRMCHKYN